VDLAYDEERLSNDHAFGNPALVDRFRPACRYDHPPRDASFSDHSAILIEIEIEAQAAKAFM